MRSLAAIGTQEVQITPKLVSLSRCRDYGAQRTATVGYRQYIFDWLPDMDSNHD